MITLQQATGYEGQLTFSWVYIGDEKKGMQLKTPIAKTANMLLSNK